MTNTLAVVVTMTQLMCVNWKQGVHEGKLSECESSGHSAMTDKGKPTGKSLLLMWKILMQPIIMILMMSSG